MFGPLAVDSTWGYGGAGCFTIFRSCGALEVTVCHPICVCVATAASWDRVVQGVQAPGRSDKDAVLRFVFSSEQVVSSRGRCVDLVGASITACMSDHISHGLLRGEDQRADEGTQDEGRLMPMLRLKAAEAAEVAGLVDLEADLSWGSDQRPGGVPVG